MLLHILGERSSDVADFIKLSLRVPPNETFVVSGIDQFAMTLILFAAHQVLPYVYFSGTSVSRICLDTNHLLFSAVRVPASGNLNASRPFRLLSQSPSAMKVTPIDANGALLAVLPREVGTEP